MGKEVVIATIVSVILGIAFLIAIYSMVWAVKEDKYTSKSLKEVKNGEISFFNYWKASLR
jgi:hypothetical protein